jgi:hypothetical protein
MPTGTSSNRRRCGEDYIEAPLRERALRVRINDDGLEYLELDGRPSPTLRPGIRAAFGRTNDSELGGPARRYLDELPYGSMDPAERVVLLDHEHLDERSCTRASGSCGKPTPTTSS